MKRIILITIGLLAAAVIGVFAADSMTGGEIAGIFGEETIQTEKSDESAAEAELTENTLTEKLKADEQRSGATGELKDAYLISGEYGMTDEEAEYISGLTDEGYELSWLLNIYSFWTTCDDDISIIKSMYDAAVENDISGRYWVEDAYNTVTDRSHGELSVEEIKEYLKKGLSIDDIKQANVISRRKGCTIEGILDEISGGKTLDEVKKEVFGDSGASAETLAIKQKHARAAFGNGAAVYEESASEKAAAENNKNKAAEYITEKLGEDKTNELLGKYSYTVLYNAVKLSESENTDAEEILNDYAATGSRTRILERSVYLG